MVSSFWGDMSDEVNVVIKMPGELVVNACNGTTSVANELAFGHLVLDMRTGQVDGQHDEGETNDVNSVYKYKQID